MIQANRFDPIPFLLVLLAAWAAGARFASAGVYTDDLGRPVTVPPRPARILSYAPNLTEILFAIGAGDRVVGRTRFCDRPPEAARVPVFGGLLDPDFEKIATLRPQVVLATVVGDPPDKVEALERLGYPVFVTDPRTVRDVIGDIEQIGRVTGAEAGARETAARMRADLDDVRRRVRGRAPVPVFVVIWQDPLRTVGRGTFFEDLIRQAGGEPILARGDAKYPQMSMEAVLEQAPAVIVLGRPGEPGRGEEAFWRKFPTIPAVRDGRIVSLDLETLSRPGPRIVGSLRALAAALHPEAFRDGRGSPLARGTTGSGGGAP